MKTLLFSVLFLLFSNTVYSNQKNNITLLSSSSDSVILKCFNRVNLYKFQKQSKKDSVHVPVRIMKNNYAQYKLLTNSYLNSYLTNYSNFRNSKNETIRIKYLKNKFAPNKGRLIELCFDITNYGNMETNPEDFINKFSLRLLQEKDIFDNLKNNTTIVSSVCRVETTNRYYVYALLLFAE
jgi:hypothetical protein